MNQLTVLVQPLLNISMIKVISNTLGKNRYRYSYITRIMCSAVTNGRLLKEYV